MPNPSEFTTFDRSKSASPMNETETALREEVAKLTNSLAHKEKEIARLHGRATVRNTDFLAVQRPTIEHNSLIDERVREIAALTEMIWERDRLIANLERRADWLTQVLLSVLKSLSRTPGQFLPGSVLKRRFLNKLASRAVFDEAAYLAANPDVAAEGVEPLHHYVMHGLAEGRSVGLMSRDKS